MFGALTHSGEVHLLDIVGKERSELPSLGIRAFLRKRSLLLRARDGTNFCYKLLGGESLKVNPELANAKPKISDRIRYVRERGCTLDFVGIERGELFGNLELLDSALPKITAYLVAYKYAGDAKPTLVALLEYLLKQNPFGFDLSQGHPFYEHKIKRLLVAAALGMTDAKVWTGTASIGNGIIEVQSDNDVTLYNAYNYGEFEKYLLNNTRLEQASTSRYKFGDLYREGDEVHIKLNLQIRFS